MKYGERSNEFRPSSMLSSTYNYSYSIEIICLG